MKKKNKYIIYAFFVFILSLLCLFYIFAKGVNINVFPSEASSEAEISLKGGISFSFKNRFIVLPGEKTLTVKAKGYFQEEKKINVFSNMLIDVNLKELPGEVTFNISPEEGSFLYIDDKKIIDADIPISLKAGLHRIKVKNPKYLKYEDEVLVKGKGINQIKSINLEPNWSNVMFRSVQEKQEVYINDEFLGFTPLNEELTAGTYKISFRKKGFKESTLVKRIDKGKEIEIISEPLELVGANVSFISFPGDAKVYVDNEYRGNTPLNTVLEVNEDKEIKVSKDGFLPYSVNRRFLSNTSEEIKFKLDPIYGKVIFKGEEGAEVFLNKQKIGDIPLTISLQTIKQKISIKKKGYRTQVKEIFPSKEEESVVYANLVDEETARYEESPKSYTNKAGITLRLLLPGKFSMGSSRSEKGQRANEIIKQVSLTKPFYISDHEITNNQYLLFSKKDSLGRDIQANNLPVTNISWQEAAFFCNWLSKNEKLQPFYMTSNGKVTGFNLNSEGYRMPTEAEWSWTARKSTKSRELLKYPWGKEFKIDCETGNYGSKCDGYLELSPVRSFNSNSLRIFDLGGNVSEMVNDFYVLEDLGDKILTDPIGKQYGRTHVVRGSNYKSSSVSELRLTYRDSSSGPDDLIGFRIGRWLIGKE